MRLFLEPWLKERMQRYLASIPGERGIKFLFRLYDRLYFFILGVIKIAERQKEGVHPKHWLTDFHSFFLDNIKPSDAVLEIGCAYGHIANAVAQKAKSVTAIDIRSDAIEKAKKQFDRSNLSFINQDFLSFPETECFDVVILSNVVEHISDRKEFLKKAARIGKRLLIRVPAFDRDWTVPYKKHLGLEWRLNNDHKLEYTDDILRKEIEQAGLSVNSLFCKWGNYCCIATKEGIG